VPCLHSPGAMLENIYRKRYSKNFMDGNELAMEMEATHSKYLLNYGNTLKEMNFIIVRKFINQGLQNDK
jgi:hypothetical protein